MTRTHTNTEHAAIEHSFDLAIEHLQMIKAQSLHDGTEPSTPTSTPESTTTVTKRGRPRMQECGETMDERRKRQIRLAQRAYRSRKEEKIVLLDRKVSDLEQRIQEARNLYLSMHNTVVNSGFLATCPLLLKPLHDDLQLFLSITKTGPQEQLGSTNTAQVNPSLDSWDDSLLNNNSLMPLSPLSSDDCYSFSDGSSMSIADGSPGSYNTNSGGVLSAPSAYDTLMYDPLLTWS